mgnify:CR=1 FL=1
MIDKNEKAQLKYLLQDPKWQVVERIVKLNLDRISMQSKLKDNQWDTIKATIFDEGQIMGITSLIQELWKIAGESE